MSRYGWMNLSLISFQMIRVISSPSNSTTGFFTLIFEVLEVIFLDCVNAGPNLAAVRAKGKDWRLAGTAGPT
jgi:hypothetical protein